MTAKNDNLNEEELEQLEEQEELVEEDQTDKLMAIIKDLEAEKQKYKDDFIRAHAEMENIRRRSNQEVEKTAKFAVKDFAKDIIVVADNLSRAVASVPEENREQSEQIKNLLAGVQMTERELTNIFERHKIKKISSIDEIFDPNYHQVVQQVEDASKPDGTIINELQTGYMIAERILREAMVVVATGGPKKDDLVKSPGNKVDTQA